MKREPKVYIALENEAGQLVIQGPLELLDRLVATLAGHARPSPHTPDEASEPQDARAMTARADAGEADHV
jgi:malonyl CoA-acyl carrier protein transacylase